MKRHRFQREAISEKTLRSTVALTAGRGRGKSSALGVAIASRVDGHGRAGGEERGRGGTGGGMMTAAVTWARF